MITLLSHSAIRRVVVVMYVVIAFVLAGSALPVRIAAQGQNGRLRFIHGIPDASAVDILVDKVLAARGLAYASATRYLMIADGDHTITVTTSSDGKTLFEGKVTVSAAQPRTAIAQGTAAAAELGVFDDELGPIAAGKTRVTAIHAIKDAPAIDVLQTGGTSTVLPLIQGLSYGQPYGTIDITAAAANIAVVAAGGEPDKAILKLNKVPLIAGTLNTFVALGTLQGTVKPSIFVITAATDPDDASKSSLVRVVHASADAPAVDVYVGETLIAPGLSFGDATPHLALNAGKLDVAVRAAGSGAASAPLGTAKLDLTAGKAFTVTVSGAADKPTVNASEDDISALGPKIARIHVINATSDGTATLSLANGPTAVSSNPTSAKSADVPAGIYDATASIDKPALQVTGNLPLSGGVLYDIIVAGSDKNSKLIVAATGLNEQPGSVPSAGSQTVAQGATPTTGAPTQVATTSATIAATTQATAQPTTSAATATPQAVATQVATQPTTKATVAATPTTDVNSLVQTAVAGSLTPLAATGNPKATATTASGGGVNVAGTATALAAKGTPAVKTPTLVPAGGQPTVTLVPSATQPVVQPGSTPVINGVVNTNPNANLKIREYPSTTARTLALVPSQTILVINGVRGPVKTKPTGTASPTPSPTFTTTPQPLDISSIWLFVTWNQPDGGTITGWVNAQFVSITKDGKPIRQLNEILAFKQIPEDTFGEIKSSSVTPVALDINQILGTIVVNEGVRLQLRRTPNITSESLTLLDNGSQVTVQSQTTVKLTGQVGEPSSPIWLFVRFETTGGAITGWVNAQFITLTLKGKKIELVDVPAAPADNLPRGANEGSSAVVPIQPVAGQGIIAIVTKLDASSNLNLRRDPNSNAEAIAKIPSQSQLNVLGRNGDGNWLEVEFNAQQGWIASAFVAVSRNGKPYRIADLKNLTKEPDTAASITPGPSPTGTLTATRTA